MPDVRHISTGSLDFPLESQLYLRGLRIRGNKTSSFTREINLLVINIHYTLGKISPFGFIFFQDLTLTRDLTHLGFDFEF